MEATVMVGRDLRVVYQNLQSSQLIRYEPGRLIIGECPVIPMEQVRDAVFGERLISYSDLPLNPKFGKDRLVSRNYRPLRDDAGTVIGIISLGFSRARQEPCELDQLRAIIFALESPESPIGERGEVRPPESCLGASEGSLRLAARLRRFLPPILH